MAFNSEGNIFINSSSAGVMLGITGSVVKKKIGEVNVVK